MHTIGIDNMLQTTTSIVAFYAFYGSSVTLRSLTDFYVMFSGDGVVTRTEYTTFTAHLNPEMFDLTHALYDDFDADKDDVLTLFDFNALFKLMDTNGNYQIAPII